MGWDGYEFVMMKHGGRNTASPCSIYIYIRRYEMTNTSGQQHEDDGSVQPTDSFLS